MYIPIYNGNIYMVISIFPLYMCIYTRRDDPRSSASTSLVADQGILTPGFEPWPSQTNDFKMLYLSLPKQ